jgi:hypothetical protein
MAGVIICIYVADSSSNVYGVLELDLVLAPS